MPKIQLQQYFVLKLIKLEKQTILELIFVVPEHHRHKRKCIFLNIQFYEKQLHIPTLRAYKDPQCHHKTVDILA